MSKEELLNHLIRCDGKRKLKKIRKKAIKIRTRKYC